MTLSVVLKLITWPFVLHMCYMCVSTCNLAKNKLYALECSTSLPIDKALDVIKHKLEEDSKLSDRTNLSPDDCIKLLEICLNCTYFVFNGQYYHQVHGAAMGSSVSPIVCNMYMEDFESRAISTAEHPPGWSFRYVDDTHTKLKKDHAQSFTDHLNCLDHDIKFMTEDEVDNALAFLDTNTIKKEDGSLKVNIYKKPTHGPISSFLLQSPTSTQTVCGPNFTP